MKKSIKLLIIIFFLTIPEAWAQRNFKNGFIITLEQDTIYGKVDYRSNSKNYKSCRFQKDKVITEYLPQQLTGFGYRNDKFFTSTIMENSFVEVLVSGELTLYKFQDYYLLQKQEGELHKLKVDFIVVTDSEKKLWIKENNKWRGILSYFISDCLPDPNDRTKELPPEEKELTALIVDYNKCKKTDYVFYTESKPWTKFEFGLVLGMTRSVMEINPSGDYFRYLGNSYSSTDPSIGIMTSVSSPRHLSNVAIQPEMHLSRSNYRANVTLDKNFKQELHDTYINLTTLSIPVSLKYSFSENNYGFYIQGGVNFDFNIIAGSEVYSEYIYKNVVNTFLKESAFAIKKSQLGYWGGIGILKPFNHFDGSIALRYFQISELDNTPYLNVGLSKIAFSFIILRK